MHSRVVVCVGGEEKVSPAGRYRQCGAGRYKGECGEKKRHVCAKFLAGRGRVGKRGIGGGLPPEKTA